MTAFGTYSRYYNLFYRDKDYAGETAFVHEMIQAHRPGAQRILDLGCGTGRHDRLLTQRGYEVTGVDISQEMLAIAKEGLASPALSFHQGDIRDIRFGRSYDAVISLFHVMSYQTHNDDLRRAFATAREHLDADGIFIFDAWYGPAVLSDRPVVRVKRLEDAEVAVTRIVEPLMHANENRVDLRYEVLVRDKASGKVEEVRETHRMRYLFRPEIEILLREAGMALAESCEWMTRRPLGFDTWGACFVARPLAPEERDRGEKERPSAQGRR